MLYYYILNVRCVHICATSLHFQGILCGCLSYGDIFNFPGVLFTDQKCNRLSVVSNLNNLKINCSLFSDAKGALINELHVHYRLEKASMIFAVSTLFCASLYKQPEAVLNILLSFKIDWSFQMLFIPWYHHQQHRYHCID